MSKKPKCAMCILKDMEIAQLKDVIVDLDLALRRRYPYYGTQGEPIVVKTDPKNPPPEPYFGDPPYTPPPTLKFLSSRKVPKNEISFVNSKGEQVGTIKADPQFIGDERGARDK